MFVEFSSGLCSSIFCIFVSEIKALPIECQAVVQCANFTNILTGKSFIVMPYILCKIYLSVRWTTSRSPKFYFAWPDQFEAIWEQSTEWLKQFPECFNFTSAFSHTFKLCIYLYLVTISGIVCDNWEALLKTNLIDLRVIAKGMSITSQFTVWIQWTFPVNNCIYQYHKNNKTFNKAEYKC